MLDVALGPLGATCVAIGAQELLFSADVGPRLGFLHQGGWEAIYQGRNDAIARILDVALGPLGAAGVAIGAQELLFSTGGVGPNIEFLSKSGGKFIVRRWDEALVALFVALGSLGAAALHVGAADAVLPGAAPPDVLAAAAIAARLLLRAGRRRVASVLALLNLVEGDHVNDFPLRAIPKF